MSPTPVAGYDLHPDRGVLDRDAVVAYAVLALLRSADHVQDGGGDGVSSPVEACGVTAAGADPATTPKGAP